MPKALTITRAPDGPLASIDVKRDRQPDVRISTGRLILTVETEPVARAFLDEEKRWRVYKLYETNSHRAVVAEEGHSNHPGETIRYKATICKNGAEVWTAMGAMDELKETLAAVGWPSVEEV